MTALPGAIANVIPFEARVAAVEAAETAEQPEPSAVERLRAALVTSAGLDDIPEPDPLVGKILFRDSLTWLYGAPGCGKSFIALDLAGCIATGLTWQGWFVNSGGPVLYLIAEGATGAKQRVRAWERHRGRAMDGVVFLPVAVQTSNATDWAAFVTIATEMRPAMVVVDTQARVTVGVEENSAKDMGEVVRRLDDLRQATGACVLIVHHTGRAGEHMRGSIAMDGAANTLIRADRSDDMIMVSCDKQKDAPAFDRFALAMVPNGSSIVLSLKDQLSVSTMDSPAVAKMAEAWRDIHGTNWVSATTVIDTVGVAKATFYRGIKALVTGGYAESDGRPRGTMYRLIEVDTDAR